LAHSSSPINTTPRPPSSPPFTLVVTDDIRPTCRDKAPQSCLAQPPHRHLTTVTKLTSLRPTYRNRRNASSRRPRRCFNRRRPPIFPLSLTGSHPQPPPSTVFAGRRGSRPLRVRARSRDSFTLPPPLLASVRELLARQGPIRLERPLAFDAPAAPSAWRLASAGCSPKTSQRTQTRNRRISLAREQSRPICAATPGLGRAPTTVTPSSASPSTPTVLSSSLLRKRFGVPIPSLLTSPRRPPPWPTS
jgi:hypothetical protein